MNRYEIFNSNFYTYGYLPIFCEKKPQIREVNIQYVNNDNSIASSMGGEKIYYNKKGQLVKSITMNTGTQHEYVYKKGRKTMYIYSRRGSQVDTILYSYKIANDTLIVTVNNSYPYEMEEVYDDENRLIYTSQEGGAFRNVSYTYLDKLTISKGTESTMGGKFEKYLNEYGDKIKYLEDETVDNNGDGDYDTDEMGRLIFKMGKPIEWTYKYVFDKYGNWLEKTQFSEGVVTGKWTREIIYYK